MELASVDDGIITMTPDEPVKVKELMDTRSELVCYRR